MNSNIALALLAGGYSQDGVQKHLVKNLNTGNYLFEDLIEKIPAKTVYIMTSRIYLPFWQQWWVNVSNKAVGKFKDRYISIFLDKANPKGVVNNPALQMTSRVASLVMNKEIDEVVFAPIDGYYDNFDFVEDLLKETQAIVVQKGRSGSEVSLDRRGNISGVAPDTCPSEGDYWGFTGIVKTTTREMLVQGTLSNGSIAAAVSRMIVGAHGNSGTQFKAIKIKGWLDVGTKDGLDGAKSLGFVAT
jgi:hypothetical protein